MPTATTPGPSASPTPRDGSPWGGVVTVLLGVLGPLGVWIVAFGAAAMLATPDVTEGPCAGLDWGCEMSPRGGIAFTGFIGGVVVVPVVILVIGIVTLLRPAEQRRSTVVTGLRIFAVAAVAMAGLVLASVLSNG